MIYDDDLTSTANKSNDTVDPLYIKFNEAAKWLQDYVHGDFLNKFVHVIINGDFEQYL